MNSALSHEEEREKTENLLNEFMNLDFDKDSEMMLFKLAELNSRAGKLGGKTFYDSDIYSIKNKSIPILAKKLKNNGYSVKIGDDYISYNNKTDNVIYFEKDGVQVSFHGDFKNIASDFEHATDKEWNGLYNAWQYRTAEEQTKAKEKQDQVEKENNEKLDSYSEIVKKYVKQLKKRKGLDIPESIIDEFYVYPVSPYDNYNPYARKQMIEKKHLGIHIPYQINKLLDFDFNSAEKFEKKVHEVLLKKI